MKQDSANFGLELLTDSREHEKRDPPVTTFKNNAHYIPPKSRKNNETQSVSQKTKSTLDDSKTRPQRRKKTSTNIIKWIYDLLCKEGQCYSDVVKWINRSKLEFRIEKQHKLAELWGQLKCNPKMNFNKFA